MKHFFSLTLFLLLISSCKKDTTSKTYTVSGKLLECSSNPIPVTNYKITLNQNAILSFTGSVDGIEQTVSTDNNGEFKISYSLKTGSGLASGSTNPNYLYLTGNDTTQYKGLEPEFIPISVKTDTSLGSIYLFKKISQVIRKVQFNNTLNSGERLEVITLKAGGGQYSYLYGPISSGTTITVDTISNFKISELNLQTKKYTVSSALKKPSYQTDFNIYLDIGDETYREILMQY